MEATEQNKKKPVSEHCCPYDGMECGDKRIAFEAWVNHVEECARQRKDYLFHTSSEEFCPRSAFDEEERKAKCYRYRVWLKQQNNSH